MRLTDGSGVDVVYEHVGGELSRGARLARQGRAARHLRRPRGEVVPFDIIPFFRSQKSIIGSFVYTREEVETCLRLAARGQIKPLVARDLPARGGARGDGDDGAARALRQDRPSCPDDEGVTA